MPFLRRPGQPTLHYALEDHTDPWLHRPTVLLQHGLGRNGRFWYRWVPQLAAHYRVLRPDWRGFGDSPLDFDPRSGYSVDALLGDLEDLIAAAGGAPVHYVGEAFGGTLGLLLAARSPQLLRSVTIISAPMFLPEGTREGMKFGHASWEEAMRALGPRGWAAAANDSTRFPEGTDPGLIHWYTDEMGKADVEALVAMARVVHTIDARPVLGDLRLPVLGLYPQAGTITGPQQALIRDAIPGIRFVELATRFHPIPFLQAQECAREWLAFAQP